MRRSTMPIWLLALFAVTAVAAVGALFLLVVIAKPVTATAPEYRVVTLGGLQYEAMLGRPIDPKKPVDAAIVAGLPARARHLPSGQMLFGAFVAVANDSLHAAPAASRIDLRDDAGHVYRPLHLPAGNPYAYVPRAISPKTRVPGVGTAADDNLAATGRLLLFRIPAARYEGGVFELVIHDPRRPARVAYLRI